MEGRLPRLIERRKRGDESFHVAGSSSGFDLNGFWSWSTSDLLSNATRGVLAEYVVAQALEAVGAEDVRTEWDAYDLVTPEGLKVEVKSSAFVQSWDQKTYSRPVFSIRPARSWDASTGESSSEAIRAADVYVFSLLAHRDQDTIDPMDLGQWEFFVVGTDRLVERYGTQRSLSLTSLQSLTDSVRFHELRGAVLEAGAAQEE